MHTTLNVLETSLVSASLVNSFYRERSLSAPRKSKSQNNNDSIRVSTEVALGRGDPSVCPPGGLLGARSVSFPIGGLSPRGPDRDAH